jgi:hypothetical protein
MMRRGYSGSCVKDTVCSVLAAPGPAACATGQRGPLGPGYDTTLDEAS